MLNTNHATCDERTVNLYNEAYSQKYRDYDEQFYGSPYYQTFAPFLTELTISFNKPIKVLDVGCGTGRYFHTLKNTAELTGIDISEPMLKLAAQPLRAEEVNIPMINLVAGSAFEHDFGDNKFDLIYSIGVLGEHAPLTPDMCEKLYDLLNDGGKLAFTVVDIDNRKNLKRKLAETAYPLLPTRIKQILDKRWETNYMTYKELDRMMTESSFKSFEIERTALKSEMWTGGHLRCVAQKGDANAEFLFV